MTHLDELIELCMHPKIQGRRGEWQVGDLFYSIEGDEILRAYFCPGYPLDTSPADGDVWLPPLSDPLRPERGLLGMLSEFLLAIRKLENGWICIAVLEEATGFDGPTPEIAVAKAIVGESCQ